MQKNVLFLYFCSQLYKSFADEFQLPPNFTRFETMVMRSGKGMTEYLWYHLSNDLEWGYLVNIDYLLSADTG
jgi:hypothetical protein